MSLWITANDLSLRVRAVAIIIVGELAVCNIEIINNKFIYPDGSLILSADYDLNKSDCSNEEVLMGFLTQINHNAVKAGVLPDRFDW